MIPAEYSKLLQKICSTAGEVDKRVVHFQMDRASSRPQDNIGFVDAGKLGVHDCTNPFSSKAAVAAVVAPVPDNSAPRAIEVDDSPGRRSDRL